MKVNINHLNMPTFLTLQPPDDKKSQKSTILTQIPEEMRSKNSNVWEKIKKKVLYDLYPSQPEGLEQDNSTLWMGTGINFFKGLLALEDSISKLKIPIPDTYCMIHGTYLMANGKTITRR